ncbi:MULTISPECIES: hypothetical protein [Cyanophyceae]|nr:hypothetical protein [Trichocoleus sp. FACHB-40]MBD2002347.1 hypothetical protein [Trichocoleus sp. FACHB-40]
MELFELYLSPIDATRFKVIVTQSALPPVRRSATKHPWQCGERPSPAH